MISKLRFFLALCWASSCFDIFLRTRTCCQMAAAASWITLWKTLYVLVLVHVAKWALENTLEI